VRQRKDIIRLDAKVISVINDIAFRAELSNGHGLVAYLRGAMRDDMRGAIAPGDCVPVEMSPYDMSVGRICRREQ